MAAGQSVTLPRGEIVQIVLGRQSACCYLAVEGGIAVPLVLGSASTYVRAASAGSNGRALQRDDFVPLAVERAPPSGPSCGCLTAVGAARDQPIRVVLGPAAGIFHRRRR